VVSQGDVVNVKIIEVDAERRRLSLSLKRVEEGAVPRPRADGTESLHTRPQLDLSEEVFAESEAAELEDFGDAEATEQVESSAEASAAPELAEPETEEPAAVVETEPAAESDTEVGETEPAPESDTEVGETEPAPESDAAAEAELATEEPAEAPEPGDGTREPAAEDAESS
jgi:small subunit ribosomal protein S1